MLRAVSPHSETPEAAAGRLRPTVCQVVLQLDVGGTEVLAAQIGRSLSTDYRFVFACLDNLGLLGRELKEDGFSVASLGRGSGVDLSCAWRLAKLLKRERVDVIHAHQYSPFFYAMAARFLGRGIPVLFTEHGRFHPDYPRRKRIAFNRLCLRRKDRVVSVGESVRQQLIHNEGIPDRRIGIVYNGVDLSPFEDAPDDRESVRREIGVGPADFLIVHVGRLDPIKDHATAIHAIQRVAAQCEHARLAVVGEGPELPRIQSEIERCGVEPYVRLLGLRRDVPRVLRAADAFLMTSVSEGIPLAVIEAMGAGLPVVSTDVGGVKEVVVDGEDGLLSPAKDDASLARDLIRLAIDADLRSQLGRAGRRRAFDLFSNARMTSEYRALYEEMIHG